MEFGSTMNYTCTTPSHHYEEDYPGTFYPGARCLEGGGWEVVAPWPTCLTSRCPLLTLLQVSTAPLLLPPPPPCPSAPGPGLGAWNSPPRPPTPAAPTPPSTAPPRWRWSAGGTRPGHPSCQLAKVRHPHPSPYSRYPQRGRVPWWVCRPPPPCWCSTSTPSLQVTIPTQEHHSRPTRPHQLRAAPARPPPLPRPLLLLRGARVPPGRPHQGVPEAAARPCHLPGGGRRCGLPGGPQRGQHAGHHGEVEQV